MLEEQPDGLPFCFNYSRSKIDRNALFALNSHFPRESISAVRTKYHRSQLNIDDLHKDLMEYRTPRPPRNHSAAYYAAFESVRRDLAFKPGSIIPLTTGAVAKHPDLPKSKSPGLPYKTMGYKNKGEAVADPMVLNQIRKIWYQIEAGIPIPLSDVACYARSHIATRDKNKIRSTWGYPLEVYMAEAAYFYPILDVLKNHPRPIIAYGVEIGNGGMTYVNAMAEAFPTRPVLLGDWSKFDKTIPAWLIRDSFKILAEAIDWSHVQDSEGKIWPVRENRSKRRWRKLVSYFIDTPIRMSDGRRYIKHCGVPSGSCFTNIIDSIVNALVMRYLTYELTGSFPKSDVYLGDDSVLVMPQLIDLKVFSEYALDQFGMIFNADKSSLVQDRSLIHFLGYYNNNGVPYKPIDTIIASTVYPEHTVHSKFDTITRLVGQAYSCFDPYDATRFVKAAETLRSEENLQESEIDDYIRSHPERFKYLSTIGVDPKTVGFPHIRDGVDTWRTLPGINRRKWSFVSYDPPLLYIKGLISYAKLQNIDLDLPFDEKGFMQDSACEPFGRTQW